MARILILDDKIDQIDALSGMLEDKDYDIESEMEPGRVMEKIRQFQPDLVTLDVSFIEEQDETGIALLQEIRTKYPKTKLPVLVVSGTLNAEKLTAMAACGIDGYIGKPVKQNDFLKKVGDCLATHGVANARTSVWTPRMVGESPAILELIVEIDQAAKAESDMMIVGESGVGKELVVAKYLELSPRKHKAFVKIDCTNIHQETFESEIFGHEKGAFTGAYERKKGRIELAQGGVVFFDEIGDLPEKQQRKLLRLLQDKEINPMGSQESEPVKMDVVVLAATYRNLHALMQEGKFRKDLYYRLKYMNVEVPPLREHFEDIPSLVGHFLEKAGPIFHKTVVGVEPGVLEQLMEKTWEGNVRDLEKCIEHGLVKCRGTRLAWSDIETYFQRPALGAEPGAAGTVDWEMSYNEFKSSLETEREARERKYYTYHLEKNSFNVAKTAQQLGVARTYLIEIMKRLGIEKPGKE